MSEIKEHLYNYALAYLKVYGASQQKDIVDSFIRSFPEECMNRRVQDLRSKLTASISLELKYHGEHADIQRLGRGMLKLKEDR